MTTTPMTHDPGCPCTTCITHRRASVARLMRRIAHAHAVRGQPRLAEGALRAAARMTTTTTEES